MTTHINNEAANQVALYGTEAIPGEAVAPTARLSGTFEASPARGAIRRREEATGGYDRLVRPSRELGTPSGTYGVDLTYQNLPALMRYGLKAGASGAPLAPGAYNHRKVPDFALDSVDTMTVIHGIEGKAFQSRGVRFDQFNIDIDATDADNVWKFGCNLFLRDRERLPGGYTGTATAGTATGLTQTGAGWTVDQWEGAYVYLDYGSHIGEVRMIAANTAEALTFDQALAAPVATGTVFYLSRPLPVLPETDEEAITVEGTRMFLDRWNPDDPTLGTTDISERMLSFNLTIENNLAAKRRWPGIIGRTGRGARWITGTIRLEDDRWDEDEALENNEFISIRVEKEGPEIGDSGVSHLARIDIAKAVFSELTPDTDNNNMTKSITFLAVLPVAGGDIAAVEAVNDLATLP